MLVEQTKVPKRVIDSKASIYLTLYKFELTRLVNIGISSNSQMLQHLEVTSFQHLQMIIDETKRRIFTMVHTANSDASNLADNSGVKSLTSLAQNSVAQSTNL